MNKNKVRIMLNIILFLSVLVQASIADVSHLKCSLEDSYCLTKQAQTALQKFVEGDPKLGIKKLDIMKMDPITVNAGGLSYKMWNLEVEGFNNTIIDEISINTKLKIMRISFHTDLIESGDYKSEGFVLTLPAYGEGKGKFVINNFQIEMLCTFEIIKNEQGKDVMDLQSFLFGADANGGVHHEFENLFNGDKAMSDIFHDIVNKNWRISVANYGRFITVKVMEDVFQAIKAYLRSQPLEDIALY